MSNRKNKIIDRLPGVKVHKSMRDALNSISGELEKQHLNTFEAIKAQAAKARKDATKRGK